MQDALLAMFVSNRGRLVGHLYLANTLADAYQDTRGKRANTFWR